MRNTRVLAGALAAALAVTLGGCFLVPGPQEPIEPPKTGLGAGFEEYTTQRLDWQDCGGGRECAALRAPVDWSDPDSEAITLALARVPARGQSQGTVFVNPGGPGGSGVDFVGQAVTSEVAENYDVVGWDPRGVGASTPVTCFTDPADIDESLYGTFDAPYDSPEWLDEFGEEVDRFAAACQENTGELLAHLDTVSTAHDLELMRAVITRDEPLVYVGYSYGTLIGATYAELFPELAGRLVLDGAVDPTLTAFDMLLAQMAGFESGFRAYMSDCLAGTGCPFLGSLDQALDQARELIGSADGAGLESGDGRTLDSATVGTGVALALYSESFWGELSDAFRGLRRGDASGMFTLADIYNDRAPGGGYATNSQPVYVATTCVDQDFAADSAGTLDRLAEIEEAAPTIGRFIALDDFALLDVACSDWPVPPAPRPADYDAAGAAPILVVGTSNDPATPYAWAQSLAEQLDSGVLVSVTGEGHTAYNGANGCVDEVVDAFLLDGTVPSSDPHC